jgi:large subunit ribosomal protein L5
MKTATEKPPLPSLKERYQQAVVPAMIAEFQYKNKMEVPSLKKTVLNVGLGEAITNAKLLDSVVEGMAQVTGQRPVVTRAKKSIAGFKVREGMAIGCSVILRGGKMYAFLERLLHAALPRIRDFRGISHKAFDGHGNYTLGLKEQIIFPEIHYEKVAITHGMDITIVTSALTDREGRALLQHFGFPFRKH